MRAPHSFLKGRDVMRSLVLLIGLILLVACGEAAEDVGRTTEALNTSLPLIVTNSHTVCAVKASTAVDDQGINCWGNSDRCQCGSCGAVPPAPVPPITTPTWPSFTPSDVVSLAMSEKSLCYVSGTNQGNRVLKCWGDNTYGQLGIDPNVTAWHYQPQTLVSSKAVMVRGGSTGRHYCSLVAEAPVGTNKSVQCWGRNGNGQLGAGNTSLYSYTKIVALSASSWIEVAAGAQTSCALKASGEVKCWGRYHGNSSPGGNQLVPWTVVGLESGVTSLSCADGHCCVVQNGGVKCWGSNSMGEFGNNTTTSSATPVPGATQVTTNVTKVYTGYGMTCATKTNGDLYCWGRNTHGSVGDGTTFPRIIPSLVFGMNGITNLAMGKDNVCGYKGGTYYCWGDNTEYQIYVNAPPADVLSPTALTLPPP